MIDSQKKVKNTYSNKKIKKHYMCLRIAIANESPTDNALLNRWQ